MIHSGILDGFNGLKTVLVLSSRSLMDIFRRLSLSLPAEEDFNLRQLRASEQERGGGEGEEEGKRIAQ
jgi:hypothetical protein